MNRICMEPFGNAGFPQVVFICSCNCIFFLPVSPHNLFVLFFMIVLRVFMIVFCGFFSPDRAKARQIPA